MRIEIERLDERGEAFAHRYAAGELSLDEETARVATEATIEGRATRRADVVRLVGKIRAGIEVYCDRCAAEIDAPLEIEFDTSFTPAEVEKAAVENVELLAGDLDRSVYEGGEVDVDDLMREQILLALPTRSLCREECRGLCPECGANLNEGACECGHKEVDPRWAALADLKKNE